MLSNHIENLQNSILWAQQQDDIDVLCLAREQMDKLLDFVNGLSISEQIKAHQYIDQVIPMEWPLWMEACRYQDGNNNEQTITLH